MVGIIKRGKEGNLGRRLNPDRTVALLNKIL